MNKQTLSFDEFVNEDRNEFISTVQKIAKSEIDGGATININRRLPTIAITNTNGDEYFFQGEEAEQLLDEVPDDFLPEEWLLYLSTSW